MRLTLVSFCLLILINMISKSDQNFDFKDIKEKMEAMKKEFGLDDRTLDFFKKIAVDLIENGSEKLKAKLSEAKEKKNLDESDKEELNKLLVEELKGKKDILERVEL